MRKINKNTNVGWYRFGHDCYNSNILIHEVNFPDIGAREQFQEGFLHAHLIARYA